MKFSIFSLLIILTGMVIQPAIAENPTPLPILSGNAHVTFRTTSDNQITALTTTLFVPEKPAPHGTIFIWPGLQPAGANYEPIGNGVLQPVLTWGPSCAPGNKPPLYSSWWISGQYVNDKGQNQEYRGCKGGPIMRVNPGDGLGISITLSGSVWNQHIVNLKTKEAVDYPIYMMEQAQNIAIIMIETHHHAPPINATFSNTIITFAKADPDNCQIRRMGRLDTVSQPVVLQGGKSCMINKIDLRQPDPNS